jgi:hypothetical protein
MMTLRKSLKILGAAALAGGLIAATPASVMAQGKNPCAPKAANPCAAKAKKAANPCAAKANPCAPKAKKASNPCAAKK